MNEYTDDDEDQPTAEESAQQSSQDEEHPMTDNEAAEPVETPPQAESAQGEETPPRPTESPPASAEITADEIEAARPTESPPSEAEAEEAYGATTWHSSKKITALYSADWNRNSWVYVAGLGWKKLADNSDSAVVALTELCARAKQTNASVHLLEDGGKITQIYVWS